VKRITQCFLWVCLGAALTAPSRGLAGGLYLTDRGTRALGRGGAFVAGTDDGQSLWYNPAGLSYTGHKQIMVDATLSFFRATFQRTTNDDFNGPPPKVNADAARLPIPTLALSGDFGLKDWSFGAAVMAPNAVLLSWPQFAGTTADGYPRPGPTRYSLISMKGSAIANIALGVAYRGIKGLSLGAGLHVIPANFRATVYLSACDYGVLCQHSEDPDYEAPATIDLKHTVTATPIFGAIYEWDIFRFGAAVMLMYKIGGAATLNATLPNAPFFGPSDRCMSEQQRETNPECARIVGNKADINLDLPLVARLGAEVRPVKALRVEVGVVYEGWSRQREFRVKPKGVHIDNALGIDRYDVGPIAMKRQMRDVFSLRVGGEYHLTEASPVVLRTGLILENGAFPNKTLTPLTLDSRKLMLALGLSYRAREGMWVDFLYSHLFMADPHVSNSIVYPQNPLRPPPPAASPSDPQSNVGQPQPVGNGRYTMEADILGLGVRWNI